MGGKIDVYNLGEKGVDTVKSPLHQSDGDLIQAQNAMPDPAGLEGGIRKRDGMSKLNAIALTGSIEGLQLVPLPAPNTRTYYAGQQDHAGVLPSNPWQSSVGGASGWAGRSTPSISQPSRSATSPGSAQMSAGISYRRRFFYAGKITVGNESPIIRVWDGVSDNELARIPFPPNSVSESEYIGHMWIHRGYLYVCAGVELEQRVFRVDIVTGEVVRVGEENTDNTVFGLSFLDRIWVGGFSDASLGRLRWIRNGEEAWTTERTAGAGHLGYMHAANFLGDLYVGTYTDAGTAAIVEKRTTANGSWTSPELTGPDTSVNYFTCFAVFNGELYCVYRSTTSLLVKKRDTAGVWTTDLNILGAGHANAHPTAILAEVDALYICFAQPTAADPLGYILRRTTGGVWSKPVTLEQGNGSLVFLP